MTKAETGASGSEDNCGAGGKKEPDGAEEVKRRGVARGLEVCSATRVMTDRGGVGGMRALGGTSSNEGDQRLDGITGN